jgi:hypothetical protein
MQVVNCIGHAKRRRWSEEVKRGSEQRRKRGRKKKWREVGRGKEEGGREGKFNFMILKENYLRWLLGQID